MVRATPPIRRAAAAQITWCKDYHHPNYEQDNAPSWPDRGSLGASEISVANMKALTG